ncbi:MAG: methionyl-tRNA formyltransferase [Rubrivivax sp.]|nr:methionyl-tRNA formyltransferase [Rubrivivax sp.]
MKLAFAGTPEFARVALQALQQAGHEIALVLTQPDRPGGRGLQLQPSAVKQWALSQGLPLSQPRSLRLDGKYGADAAAAQAQLQAAAPQLMVVAAYGLILPPWVLTLPALGCLNIHGSLLPRWRGAAPIQRAIEAGDARTGITIMQMDAGLDTGDTLLEEAVTITPEDTSATLHDRLAALGARLIVQAVDDFAHAGQGRLQPRPQPAAGISYAHKIDKAEAALDWSQPAVVLERRIRAFDPFPGCTTVLGGQLVKVWRAEVVVAVSRAEAAGPPGCVLQADGHRLVLACGEGALALMQLQRAGGRRIGVRELLQQLPLRAG